MKRKHDGKFHYVPEPMEPSPDPRLGHTDKVSGLNESKKLATREKLEVWGINSTLGNYQIAVYLWNSGDVVLYKICIWLIE